VEKKNKFHLSAGRNGSVSVRPAQRWTISPFSFRGTLYALAILLISLPGSTTLLAQSAEKPVYLDATQPISARVDDLIRRMMLKVKVGQLNLPGVYVDALGKTIPEKMEVMKKFAAGCDRSRRRLLYDGRSNPAEQYPRAGELL
jgi:hypothetical protein